MPSRRLLILSPSHAVRGGVETIVNDLARELPARGWETVLGLGAGARFNDVDAYRAAHPELPIVPVDGSGGTRQARVEAISSVMRRVRPDVVLAARVFDAYAAVARARRRGGGTRLAVAIRACEPHYLYDARLHRDGIDLCVVDGELLRALAIDWSGLEPDRVVSIPGGIRPPEVPVGPREARGVLRIGYVGRLEQSDKRVLDLVPLVAQLDAAGLEYRLSIVGTGPDEAELRDRLRGPIAEGRVRMEGWKTQSELYREIFPALDCLVHLSPAEGVTIAPREAMAHGVVPVISRFLGLRSEAQFVHGANALTFPVGDVALAAAELGRLAAEPGLLARLSAAAMRSQPGPHSHAGTMDAWARALDASMDRPPVTGEPPAAEPAADGRLARLGLPPGLAQRVRDLLGRRMVHGDPGSEWPTGSGLLTPEAAREIMDRAAEHDRGRP